MYSIKDIKALRPEARGVGTATVLGDASQLAIDLAVPSITRITFEHACVHTDKWNDDPST